ncbi:MAG: DegT/DnrJ/EryC1/StrS family aminotransferase [Candidatus Rokuibacteriota bacterium]
MIGRKNRLEDLAIFGGTPAFVEPLHVGRPNIGERQLLLARINDLLERKWLTNNGPYVQELERTIADFLGVKHCIAMCSGTVALEITIRSLGLHGEVIIPSFTFIATAHALLWQHITPVFSDIDRKTHNIDPGKVEQLITERTTGIIGVHLWGRACEVNTLTNISRRYDLKLVFDAAHAFGGSYEGHMIGNFGDAEVFSFHATKFFNTFEGGAAATNDDELAARIRTMRNFGFAGYDNVMSLGTNGKMSEVAAAMGLTSFQSLDEFIAVNHRNYRLYQEELGGVPGVQLLTYGESERYNYHYIVLEIDEARAELSRDQLCNILWAENVRARRYFYPGCHRMEPYRSLFPDADLLLPNTEYVAGRVLCLPTGTAVRPDEISRVCEIVRLAVAGGREVKARLPHAVH